MSFPVFVSESAEKTLNSLDKKLSARIRESLKMLKENPFRDRPKADIKKIAGSYEPPFYRLRIGDYRAVYTIEGKDVKITSIIHREKGYKWLE